MFKRIVQFLSAAAILIMVLLFGVVTHVSAATTLYSKLASIAGSAVANHNVKFAAGTTVSVKVDCPSGSAVIPYVSIFKPDTTLLTSFNSVVGTGNCGGGMMTAASVTFMVPVSGTYRIEVSNNSVTGGNYTVKAVCKTCFKGDGRINYGHGDTYVALYPGLLNGKHTLEIYCINSYNGQFGGRLVKTDFEGFPKKPETNTLVKTFTTCVVPVDVYILTSGEYQVNIGPDGDGKTGVTIFTGLPPANIHNYNLP